MNTEPVWEFYRAVNDRVTSATSSCEMYAGATGREIQGSDALRYHLEVIVGDKRYGADEMVFGDMHEHNYWPYREDRVWRRLCVKMLDALIADRPGFMEGVRLPLWLVPAAYGGGAGSVQPTGGARVSLT